MLVRKIIAVYCEKHKIHINTKRGSIQIYLMLHHIYFFAVALRPNASHGLLILEVSRSHTTTHHSQ
jgi:hypothetical protein